MQSEELILIGGGGFAMEILCYLQDLNNTSKEKKVKVVGIVDNGRPRLEDAERILGYSLTHWDDLKLFNGNNCKFVIGIGNPVIREKIRSVIVDDGSQLFSVVHPSAYVAQSATIGTGAIVSPFVFVGPMATVRTNSVLNTYASVGHDAEVGPSAVLSPYAALNGSAKCGCAAFLGSQAIVAPSIILGNNSKLSAGSILTKDTEDNCLAVGNPAKSRVMFHPLPDIRK
jgi:sugar O-acyltransferase (sialic acid O-acetyltransferase NeuD family)